jgi:hypothetical protein
MLYEFGAGLCRGYVPQKVIRKVKCMNSVNSLGVEAEIGITHAILRCLNCMDNSELFEWDCGLSNASF